MPGDDELERGQYAMFCTLFLRIAVAFLHVTGKKCPKGDRGNPNHDIGTVSSLSIHSQQLKRTMVGRRMGQT
jgi:hypothetical protein